MRVDVLNAGEHGIIPDASDSSIPPSAWTDGINFRQKNGAMETVSGRVSTATDPSIRPRFLMPLDTTTTDHWLYAGWDDITLDPEIWSLSSAGVHTNRTPAVINNSETETWYGTQYGDVPILTNGVDAPMYWDGGLTFLPLTDWPANVEAEILVSFNGYLVAANITESGTPNERLIRWSNTADPGFLPDSWDFTDPTVEAGRTELAEDGGAILDAKELGGVLYLYREKATYAMTWVRGTYVFNFRQAFGGWGVISRHCVAEFAGRHWVFADADIISHDGTSINSIITQKQRDYIFNDIDVENQHNSFVCINNAEHEVWFCYPEIGEEYPTKAFTYNVLTQESGFRQMANTIHGASGIRLDSATPIWDNQNMVWDDAIALWDSNNTGTSKYSILTCAPTDKKIYQEDVGGNFDGENISAYVERVNLQLPQRARGSRHMVTAVRPYVDVAGLGSVTVRIGNQRTKSSGLVWSSPLPFNPDSDYKVSSRKTGRHPAVRFQWEGKGVASINGYSVDLQPCGSR